MRTKTNPGWKEGDTVESPLGINSWRCIVAEPDDRGHTVWECTSYGETRYIVVDWVK